MSKILIRPVFPQLSFFHLRVDDKQALLLHLLRNVMKPQEQTVVFVATKHHVEYVKEVRYEQQSDLDSVSIWLCSKLQTNILHNTYSISMYCILPLKLTIKVT